MSVKTIENPTEFKPSGRSVVLFVASFHEACRPGGQMDTVFNHLASTNKSGWTFYKVDAEEQSDLAEEFNVEVVPTVVFLQDRKILDKIEGAHPAKVAEKIEAFGSATKSEKDASGGKPVFKRIEDLLASSYVFLFMKGTPDNAKCKFSKKMLELLSQAGIKNFGSFDVLSDDTIRQGLKEYANWPTFPQLYAGSKLIGGVDIAEELAKDGELAAALTPAVPEVTAPLQPAPQVSKKATLEDRLEKLINKAPVVLFMKGDPDEPRCGFSSQIVAVLKNAGVEFDYFDILTDDAVRQGLKVYSDWPTYPQLYSRGKLVGGLDIVRELAEDGSLLDALNG